MNHFDESEYQGRDPKRVIADIDALIYLLKFAVPLFLGIIVLGLLIEIFG